MWSEELSSEQLNCVPGNDMDDQNDFNHGQEIPKFEISNIEISKFEISNIEISKIQISNLEDNCLP